MNAIALLKADHRVVEQLFDKLDGLTGKSARGKKTIVDQLVRELSIHVAIEEQIFYPAVREIAGEEEAVLEALEEHGVAKWELDAIQSMDVDDERLDAKLRVLRDVVLHHIEREESEVFPKARHAFGVARLNELGDRLEAAKKVAPTRPHPRAPSRPPANIAVGMAAGVVDRARDVARAAVRGRRGKAERAPSAGRATRSARATKVERGSSTSRGSKPPAKRGRATARGARGRRAQAV